MAAATPGGGGIDIPVRLDTEQAAEGFAQLGEAAANSAQVQKGTLESLNALYSEYVAQQSQVKESAASAAPVIAEEAGAFDKETKAVQQKNQALVEFNQQTGLAMKAMPEEAAGILQNIQLYDSLTNSQSRTSMGYGDVYRSAREFRLEAMMGVMALSEIQIAMGDKLPPAAQEASKGIMMVADGFMAGIMTGDPLVGVLGAVVGGVLAVGIAVVGTDEKVAALNKSFDSMSKKDELVTTLSSILGVSEQTAAQMEAVAAKSPAAAAALKEWVDNTTKLNVFQATLQDVGITWEAVTGVISKAGPLLDSHFTQLEQIRQAHADAARTAFEQAQAEQALGAALATTDAEIAKNIDALRKDTSTQEENLQKKVEAAQYSFTTGSAAATRDATEQSNKAYRDLGDSIDRINTQIKEQTIRNADEGHKYQRDLDQTLLKDKQTLTDELDKIAHEAANKQAQYTYDLTQKQIEYTQKAEQAMLDEQLKEQSIDFDTSIKVATAKTEREAEQTIFQANFKKAQDQEALQSKLSADQRSLLSAEDRLAHDKAIADQDTQYAIDQARHKYSEEVALAEQSFSNRISDQITSINEENAKYTDQFDELKHKYEEQQADIKLKLSDRRTDLSNTYSHEMSLVQQDLALFVQAEMQKVNALMGEMQMVMSLNAQYQQMSDTIASAPTPSPWLHPTILSTLTGGPSLPGAIGGAIQNFANTFNFPNVDPQQVFDIIRSYFELSSQQ